MNNVFQIAYCVESLLTQIFHVTKLAKKKLYTSKMLNCLWVLNRADYFRLKWNIYKFSGILNTSNNCYNCIWTLDGGRALCDVTSHILSTWVITRTQHGLCGYAPKPVEFRRNHQSWPLLNHTQKVFHLVTAVGTVMLKKKSLRICLHSTFVDSDSFI